MVRLSVKDVKTLARREARKQTKRSEEGEEEDVFALEMGDELQLRITNKLEEGEQSWSSFYYKHCSITDEDDGTKIFSVFVIEKERNKERKCGFILNEFLPPSQQATM